MGATAYESRIQTGIRPDSAYVIMFLRWFLRIRCKLPCSIMQSALSMMYC